MHRILPALFLLLCLGPAGAQSLYVEGQHYLPLSKPQATEGTEVKEFFSYGCPHCFEFEETLTPWVQALPENVRFERVPAGLGRRYFQLMAVIYHVAEALDVQATMHPVLFDEIHNKKSQAMGSMEGIAGLFTEHAGITQDQFAGALNSPKVMEAFERTEGMQATYELQGVPMLVVNGKYRISRNQYVTSYPQMLEIAEHLIQQEQAAP